MGPRGAARDPTEPRLGYMLGLKDSSSGFGTMVGRDGAFGILIGAAVGTLFHVPAHGSAQDSLSVSCVDVNLLSPSKDLTRCAEQAKAHYVLALRYAAGVGVPEDDAEAFRWYRLAAEEGHAEAQSVLGFKYANGVDVPEDDAEAARWYRLAAEQGNTAAQFNLGLMYYNGEGVPEGDAEAARWYRLAAEQGNTAAQFNLGGMYAGGIGVPGGRCGGRALVSVSSRARGCYRPGEPREHICKGRKCPSRPGLRLFVA